VQIVTKYLVKKLIQELLGKGPSLATLLPKHLKRFVDELNENRVLMVMDFKMKLLWQPLRESSSNWYGQRGNSDLAIVFI